MQRRSFSLATIIFLCAFFCSSFCFAQVSNLAFSRNARTFETQQASLVSKSMAFACLSLEVVPDGLPCNPAFTPLRKSAIFGVEGLLSNGYSTLSTMQKLLAGTIDQDLVNALFGPERVLQIEANAELDLVSHFLNARYTPASVKYFSVVRNEANPNVDLYAVQEDNFILQSGTEILKGFYAGIQIRNINRKFVKEQFSLLILSTDQGKLLLTPHNQQATYIEPGIAYVYDSLWRPRISAMIANLGVQRGDFTNLIEPIEGQYSLGMSPPLPWGKLDLEVDYRSMTYDEPGIGQRLHFGGLYHFGAMNLSGGIDYNGISGGIFYGLQQINAGITYSTTRVPWRSEDYFTQTVYVQFGWQI